MVTHYVPVGGTLASMQMGLVCSGRQRTNGIYRGVTGSIENEVSGERIELIQQGGGGESQKKKLSLI